MNSEFIASKIDELTAHDPGNAHLRAMLEIIAIHSYGEGRHDALAGLMTVEQVAEEFGVSRRRANAIIQYHHERFGTGQRFNSSWLVHRDELDAMRPDEKYRKKANRAPLK